MARTDRGVTLRNNIENWEAVKPRRKVVRKRSNLNGHALPVCETGKLRYRDRTQAGDALTIARHQGAAARSLDEHTNRNECRVYACGACGGFHLTSKPSRRVEVGA